MVEKKIIDTVEKLRLVSHNMPKVWDGRESILEMKNADYKHWHQIEWLESYFKFLCQKHFGGIIDIPGQKYSNMRFDAFREISWDFKADSVNPGAHSVTANDAEGIANTISDYGYYGIILAIGDIKFDDKETSFKKWHDNLREEVSKYDANKINSRIMSRTRKIIFILEEIHFICFNNETIHQCCGFLQDCAIEADSNGLKRKEVVIDTDEIPNVALVATETF